MDRFLSIVPAGMSVGLFVMQLDKNNRIATSFGPEQSELCRAHYTQLLREFLPAKTPVIRLRGRLIAVMVVRPSAADVVTTARTLIERVEPRMSIGHDQFSIDVTMGVAIYPNHAVDGARLLRRAEFALESAKDADLNYDVYETDASTHLKALWRFESELKQAIADGAFEVHYQPQFAIAQNRMSAAEALVRWRNENGSLMPASEFIPAAQRSGSIVPLTWVVFDQVGRDVAHWRFIPRPFSISVNTPPQALGHSEFFPRLDRLKAALGEYRIKLTVELTEDGLMQTDCASLDTLNKIRELGVGLAIDDFGKGYSSLNYLRQIPATELKIDGQFVNSVAHDEKDRQIVKTAIELGDAFDMAVVAEGVDNAESLRVLAGLDCNVVQGFFIARPMNAEALAQWIRSKPFGHLQRVLQQTRSRAG
jgi:EAL domain-containing protein (putative c-di-GMP-specific phosphodiesterase class I)